MSENIVSELRREFEAKADKNVVISGKRFFKEETVSHGLKAGDVKQIAKEYFKKIKDMPKSEIFAMCEDLWQSGYLEESFTACHWSYALVKQYEPEDFKVFDKWVHNYVTNWASCDTLCNHNVGDLVMMYPQLVGDVKKWSLSDNRWVKRASAVTFIIPARKGLFLTDIFEIADTLMMDSDDLVQKGYGWMLKAASESYQQEVFEYVMKHKAVMPRTALRYAIEKMPAELKIKAMVK